MLISLTARPGRHAAPGRRTAQASTISTLDSERRWTIGGVVALAALAYVPMLAVRPGVITANTKPYLYLDPTKFLSQVPFLWNPTVALGTVTHEYIGYLLPMGPFFALADVLHIPTWIAQRLWLGSVLFIAGVGILYLCRTMRLRGPGPVVAALAYMLSPYFLQYVSRISVILLPWSGLPFMLAFTILALRRGGWRWPALFAITVALVSGINATAIIYVGVAPVLWLIFAVVVLREATWWRAIDAALRIAILTLGACLWWMAGLLVEAAYGVNVLKYTETVPSTSATSSPSEVIRGLGYWFFYGGDSLGPWTNAAARYTQSLVLLATSYAVPVFSVVAAAFVRWRERAFFIVLIFVGLVLSVGPFPFTNPTVVGRLFKSFMTNTTAGLALRSTDRATPVVLLGLVMLLAAGVTALWQRVSILGILSAFLLACLVVANNPSIFNGDMIANYLTIPGTPPAYEMQAITHLNDTHQGTRVLAIPGDNFASYRWGDPLDTPQPAYLTRDFVTREQQVMGSIATADTLYAVDDPIQENTENYSALAPMARLMSAGDIMVEYDQRYEHYGVPQPQLLALQLLHTPSGLSDPVSFGAPRPNVSAVSTLNEADLSAPATITWPSPVVTYTVNDPRATVRGESDQGAMIVSADAVGLNNLAGLGLLNTSSALYYTGTLDKDKPLMKNLATQGAQLVVTDTNRKQAFRWNTLNANTGATETPDEHPAKTDLSDSPVELFPGTSISSKTYASYVGAVNVTASSYGNPVSFTPENRAYSALDSNLDTSWNTGTFVSNPSGQWWQVQFSNPVTTNHITLVQLQRGDRTRWISKVTLTFDGTNRETFDLGKSSYGPAGQQVTFPTTAFHTLRVTVDATTNDTQPPPDATAVGFAEVEIPGVHVQEVIQMPSDLTSAVGAASAANRLTYVMTRLRTSPYPTRSDPETTITREFQVPTTRTFALSGSASLSSLLPDDEIDKLVGRTPTPADGYISAYSSGRMPGNLNATASGTLDDNPATAWQPGFDLSADIGATLTYSLTKPQTLSGFPLTVLADGRHSVPTTMTVTAGNQVRTVTLPSIADSTVPGATTTVPVSFAPLTGSQFVITFTGVRAEYAKNYYSTGPLALPLGIVKVGLPGVLAPPTPASLPGTCVSNLVSIDGQPIDVSIVGSTQNALDNGDVQVVPCGPDAKGITLGAGPHIVQTAVAHNPPCANAPSLCTGWNVDQLVLDSAAGGVPGPAPAATTTGPPSVPPVQAGAAPTIVQQTSHIDSQNDLVSDAHQPFEFVLGQSVNKGWKAVAVPGPGAAPGSTSVNLGTSQLIDGFANGWQVTAADLQRLGGSDFTIQLTWTPQKEVWAALAVSGAVLLLCLVLGLLPSRPRRWVRAKLPGRLRGPAGPEVAALHSEPFDAPVLTMPFSAPPKEERQRGWLRFPRAVLIGAVTGGVAALVVSGAAALVVGALVALGLVVPWARVVAVVGGVAFIVAGCANVVRGQYVHNYMAGANWAGSFVHAGNLIWVGVVLLLADAVITGFGLRVKKPLGRGKLRALDPDQVDSRPIPPIVGIDG
jgi:arabinofuranan 3-O-arabinosyltransferase